MKIYDPLIRNRCHVHIKELKALFMLYVHINTSNALYTVFVNINAHQCTSKALYMIYVCIYSSKALFVLSVPIKGIICVICARQHIKGNIYVIYVLKNTTGKMIYSLSLVSLSLFVVYFFHFFFVWVCIVWLGSPDWYCHSWNETSSIIKFYETRKKHSFVLYRLCSYFAEKLCQFTCNGSAVEIKQAKYF